MSGPDPRPLALVTSGSLVFHPRHFHLLAEGLYRSGLPVVVVGRETEDTEPSAVPIVWLPRAQGRLRRMLAGPATVWRAVRLRPALIQVNSLDLLPWGVLAKVIARCPVLYDCKEDYASYMLLKSWLPGPLRVPLSKLVGFAEPRLAGLLDGVVFADAATAERFRGRVRRSILIHNYPWRSMAEGVDEAEARYDVVYNGTLPSYHVDNFIATASELDRRGVSVRWCLAAREYDEEHRRALEDRLRDAGLRERFTLLYNLPFAEMRDLLSRSRIGFVPLPDFPKFRRNIPRKLFEFMAVGRPAVASDLPPMRGLPGIDACCVFATPGSASEYADAIQALLEDPERASRMGRAGRELILSDMNAETELQPYVDLCRELSLRAG